VARDLFARLIVRGLAVRPRVGGRRDLAGRRRRITFLAVYAYATGGVPRAVFSVANELAARGHEVEVVSVLRSRPAPYVDVHPAVRVSYLEDRVNPDPTAKILPRARKNPRRRWLVRYLDRQPTQLADDAYPALSLKAAALLESVVRNHPFVDGNKRSGWTLAVTFLWINGFRHDMTAEEGFDLVVGVAEGRVGLEASAAAWEAHLIPRS